MADVSRRLEKAEKYLQKGKMEDALQEFQEALQEDPENNPVRERAADLCITINRPKEAAALLGVLFDRQAEHDPTKAIYTYKKMARVSSPPFAQMFRYAQLIEKSSKKEALELLQRAAEGFAATAQKKDALAVYKYMLSFEPSLQNLKVTGELATELTDGKTAAEAFYQAGSLEKKDKHDGYPWFSRAYALDAENVDVCLAYGRSLIDRGDAATALRVVEPLAKKHDCADEILDVYARALMGVRRAVDAEPIVWHLYEKDPKRVDDVGLVIGSLIDVEEYEAALELARRTAELEEKSGRYREFVSLLKDVTDQHAPNPAILEYMVAQFNATNREHDYCQALIKLFQLYYAAGNYLKAGDSLDAAAEVDPYEPEHQKRLEMLQGKIDGNRHRAIANRFTAAVKLQVLPSSEENAATVSDNQPTVLEDFMLQAEIFLQYSMRSKAVERLERIQKLFPHEEERNEKLRSLYMSAGMMPKYDAPAAGPAPVKAASSAPPAAAPAPQAGQPSPAPATGQPAAAQPVAQAQANENAVDNISRVTEITRNIYRQSNVKSVLFAAVNDVGRHWNASRCVAGLCNPGKPPAAALEYCAPGVKQSDVMAIVKLIGTLQNLAVGQGPVAITNVKNAPELHSIKQYVDALEVQSLLAVPLLDGDEHSGILILEQCGYARPWRPTDVLVLKTIADQMMLAVNNAKLRNLMKTLAVTDEKSGLLKRSSYVDVLLAEVRRALQQSSQSSVMLLNFGKPSSLVKEIGEAAVESMMQQIGQICCTHIRQNDVAVRYDLTTIALVLADTTDKNAFFVVDKLRKVLNTIKVPGTDRTVPCTVGIAEAVMLVRYDPVDIVTEVINRVEAALEAAKAEGGNKAQSLAPILESAVA